MRERQIQLFLSSLICDKLKIIKDKNTVEWKPHKQLLQIEREFNIAIAHTRVNLFIISPLVLYDCIEEKNGKTKI